jgi:hypothetical protein
VGRPPDLAQEVFSRASDLSRRYAVHTSTFSELVELETDDPN